jgi:hypothetical protein
LGYKSRDVLIERVFIIGEGLNRAWEGRYGRLPFSGGSEAELEAFGGRTIVLIVDVIALDVEHVCGCFVVVRPGAA